MHECHSSLFVSAGNLIQEDSTISINVAEFGCVAKTMDELSVRLPALVRNMTTLKQGLYGFQCAVDRNAVAFFDLAIEKEASDALKKYWRVFKAKHAFSTDTLAFPSKAVRTELGVICKAFSLLAYGKERKESVVFRTLYNGVNLERHPEIARLCGCAYSMTLGTPSNKRLWAMIRSRAASARVIAPHGAIAVGRAALEKRVVKKRMNEAVDPSAAKRARLTSVSSEL